MASTGLKIRHQKRDVPDYRPLSLRLPFLALLFVLICGLIGTLEYLLRILPHLHDRPSFPSDPVPDRRKRQEHASPGGRHRTSSYYPSATPVASPSRLSRHAEPTTFIAAAEPRAIKIPTPAPSPEPTPEPRLRPSAYGNTDVFSTHITWADRWVGDAWNPYLRQPVYPGEDTADKCVYMYQGIVMNNDTGCLAYIGASDGDPLVRGWTRATWLRDDIWFPPEGCGLDTADDWYSGSPSNETDQLAFFDTPFDVLNNRHKPFNTCYEPGGVYRITGLDEAFVAKRDPHVSGGSILLLYMGWFLPRGPDKRILWNDSPENPWRSWGMGNQEFIPRGLGFTLEFNQIYTPSATAGGLPPSSSALTTAISPKLGGGPVVASTSELRSKEKGQQPSYVSVPVTLRSTTTIAFTSDGVYQASTMRYDVSTKSILLAVPAVMVTAKLTTETYDQGRSTATLTDYGGNVLMHQTTLTLTGAGGSATATVVTQAPVTSSLKTMTNADGVATSTATIFPVTPIIPGATPADIVIPRKADYFTVYFLPVLLTALLSAPLQAVNAELKALLPLRLLTRPGGSPDALTMRPSVLTSLQALWRHRDPFALIGDLLVLCTTALVSLSAETIGLQLQGTCYRRNLNMCVITVAAFPGPARAAEALLIALAVLILLLMAVLARWRTGVAAHPSSIATVCALLQGVEAQDAFRRISLDEAEKDANRRLKDGLRHTPFVLRRYEPAPRADDYGLEPVRAGTLARHVTPGEDKKKKVPDVTRVVWLLKLPSAQLVFRGGFLFVLCSLLALTLYYENTEFADPTATPFEWFMDSQSFGVRMLFTGAGVVVGLVWEHLFSGGFPSSSPSTPFPHRG